MQRKKAWSQCCFSVRTTVPSFLLNDSPSSQFISRREQALGCTQSQSRLFFPSRRIKRRFSSDAEAETRHVPWWTSPIGSGPLSQVQFSYYVYTCTWTTYSCRAIHSSLRSDGQSSNFKLFPSKGNTNGPPVDTTWGQQ